MLEPDRDGVVEESPTVADILHSQEVVQSAGAHIDKLQARVMELEEALNSYDHDPEYWKERLLLEQGERKVLEAEVERLKELLRESGVVVE